VKPEQDAFGQAMLDHLAGKRAWEIAERDDGYFSVGAGPELYFAEFEDWRPVERQAMRYVRGRVLDVGCGAGRVLLHLQAMGHEVVGIDTSPGAIETCRRRGASDVHEMSLGRVSSKLGTFDTVVMMGGNLGLLGNRDRAPAILRRLHRLTGPRGRIVGGAGTTDPVAYDYVRRNIRLGRISGQCRIRIRYKTHVTPWFDYFRLAPDELEGILRGTGWAVRRIIPSRQDIFVAVIDKES
jgi:SAM-dependent methyltransferase